MEIPDMKGGVKMGNFIEIVLQQ